MVRYGNVIGSRGSVVPLFRKLIAEGADSLPLTDERMTRFWLTLDEAVDFVLAAIARMHGGEVFVPRIPSMSVTELASVLAPNCKVEITGIRPGEQLHEVLLSSDEARHAVAYDDMFVIKPEHQWWGQGNFVDGAALPAGFEFSSDTNDRWLSPHERVRLAKAA